MLNKKKQIQFGKQKIEQQNSLFFNLPLLPSTSFIQSNTPQNALNDLNVVSTITKAELSCKNFRFSSSLKDLRSYRLAKKHQKQIVRRKEKLKSSAIFVNYLFKKQKWYSFFLLKQVKGGFMTTSSGLTSFMPKSLGAFAQKGGEKQYLLSFKIFKKSQRFSSKSNAKINLVTSSKLLLSKDNSQKKI
jgi:hypothetical protein